MITNYKCAVLVVSQTIFFLFLYLNVRRFYYRRVVKLKTGFCERDLDQTNGLQRNVVYLGWRKAPLYMSPHTGKGGGVVGSQPISTAAHRAQIKIWRSNSIFSLWIRTNEQQISEMHGEEDSIQTTLNRFWPPICNRIPSLSVQGHGAIEGVRSKVG